MGQNTEENMGGGQEVAETSAVTGSGDVSTANAFKSVVSASSTTGAATLFDNHLDQAAVTVQPGDVSHFVRKRRRPGDPAIVRTCRHCGNPFKFRRTHISAKHRGIYCSRACHAAGSKGISRPAIHFVTPPSTKAERIRANGLINMRIRRGHMDKPKACQRCGKKGKRLDGHHPDYKRPALVAFLCRSCHMLCHNRPEVEAEVAVIVARIEEERLAAMAAHPCAAPHRPAPFSPSPPPPPAAESPERAAAERGSL